MLGALKYRNFRLFFFGQGISLIGTWMQQVAMIWLVYRLTNSAFLLGLVGFCSQIPSFFLAPVGRRVHGPLEPPPDDHRDPEPVHDSGRDPGPAYLDGRG